MNIDIYDVLADPVPSRRVGVGQTAVFAPGFKDINGVQHASNAASIQVGAQLMNLFLVTLEAPSIEGATEFEAASCERAESAGGSCGNSAYDMIKVNLATVPGAQVAVDVGDLRPNKVRLWVLTSDDAARSIAPPGGPVAVINLSPQAPKAEKKEEKASAARLVTGAAIGGAVGFFAGGPVAIPAAAGGAAIGALLANVTA